MKLLTWAEHFIYLIFSTDLCCRCPSLVVFCRTWNSRGLSNLFEILKPTATLRVKFGLVDDVRDVDGAA